MTYSSEVLADSPLAYWRLGDGVVLADSSGNSRHGAYSGTSAQVTGLVSGDTDKAHSFASGSYGLVADAAWLDASPFTVLATITPTAVTGTQTIVARYDGFTSGAFNSSSFALRLNGNKLECHIFVGNSPGAAQTVATLTAGTTYDVAATYDGTTVTVYLNGSSAATAPRSGMNNSSQPLTIGSTSSAVESFGGVIDDVSYFGAALSSSQVSTLATQRASGSGYAAAVLALSPLAYYRLNDASAAATMTDASGNGRTGTYTNVALAASGALTGDANTAAVFNGTSAHADVPYASWMGLSTAFTIEAWIKTTASGVRSIADRDANFSRVYQFRTNGGSLEFLNLSGGVSSASQAVSINDGAWHHVAATYDGSNIRLYKDGALVNTTSAPGTLAGTDALVIGGNNSSGYTQLFAGSIDEVAYYGTVLTGARLAAHYAAGTGAGPSMAGTVNAVSGVSGSMTGPSALMGTVAAVSGVAGTLSGGSVGLSGTVAVVSEVSGEIVDPTAPDDADEAAPELELPTSPTVTDSIPVNLAIATSVPAPVLTDGRADVDLLTAGAAEFTEAWGSWRLIIGGEDVTFFRGYPAQIGSVTYEDPWGYGPASFVLPGLTYWDLTTLGTGDTSWWTDWARVVLERVKPDSSVETLWRGFIGQQSPGRVSQGFSIACPGEAQGRLNMIRKLPRPFAFRKDVGRMIYDLAISRPAIPIRPVLGLDTGIMLDERSRAGGTGLDACNELLALGEKNGQRLTVMPTSAGTYLMQYADETTVHATVFLDAPGVEPDLTSNLLDRPTTVYAAGRFANGGLYFNAKAPGLFETEAPDFPGTIGPSTTDGDLINDWQSILMGGGYMTREDGEGGGYNAATVAATKELQEDAGLSQTGVVNSATWDAAFDRGVTGLSLSQSHCAPFAQLSAVRRYNYTPSGVRYGDNDDYDRERPPVEEFFDMGVYPKSATRKWARARVARLQAARMWAGTLRLENRVSVFAGDYHHGDPDPVLLHWMTPLAGKNIMFRGWDGDTLLHVAADNKDANGATLTVDSMGRPALEVRQLVERRREGRQNPAKTFIRQHKGVEVGGMGEWLAELGGEVTVRRELPADQWSVIRVVAGDEGQIEKFQLRVKNSVCEFAVAIFAKPVTASWVHSVAGNPFDADGWQKDAVHDALDRRLLLYAAGDKDQPCGYPRKPKSEGGALTGLHRDGGGFAYRTFADDDFNNGKRGLLYIAVYPKQACVVPPQRVLWPAYEVGM